MSELLNDNSVVNIKSMGQGALSTASFRGTSSSHTQVLWNGISLNSATLGSFDFSQIPIYFTDDITLYHGSSAQQSGSGAIGGSVNFSSNDRPTDRPIISVMGEYGSNNTVVGGATLRITKGRLTSSTRLFYQQSDNDYRYLNKIFSKDPFYERRADASYKQAGAMQELFYKTKQGDKLNFMAWGQYDDRSLPQSIMSVNAPSEHTSTFNLRAMASYQAQRGDHSYKLALANLWSDLEYQKDFSSYITNSDNRGNSVIFRGDYAYNINPMIEIGTTLKYRNDLAVTTDTEEFSCDRNTYSLRAYGLFRPLRKLHFDVDGSLEAVDKHKYAIYNLSVRYMVRNNLTLKASNAYNYRMPSLNDMYWSPGGNPDLKPEKGFSWDASAIYTPSIGVVDLEFEALYYHMDIKDWIMWIPKDNGPIWSPVNFSSVLSQGAEFNAKLKTEIGATRHSVIANYTYAYSVDNSQRGDDAQGKQLPYIPRNKWNVRYEVWWRDAIWLNYNVNFTDIRFTSADEEYCTEAHTLHNAEIGSIIKLKRDKSLRISLKVDNIFNSYYESTQYYPMPLRMYRLQLSYRL